MFFNFDQFLSHIINPIILLGRFIYLARNWTSDSSRLDKMLDYFSRCSLRVVLMMAMITIKVFKMTMMMEKC